MLEIGKLLGVEAQNCNGVPNKGWNMADSEMEGRKLMWAKQIFKSFSDKISYLICPENPSFHEHNDVQGTKFFESLKENLTNLTFLGRKETSITAASIISKSFDLKHACALTEEKFSHLAEDESASMSQGKQKIGKDRYTLLRKIYDIISSGGNVPKLNYTFHIDTIKVVSLMHHIQENI